MIETVHRVRCSGGCGRYLRNGRPAPAHWGPMYAQAFGTAAEAWQAALDAGWQPQDGGLFDAVCPSCHRKGQQL